MSTLRRHTADMVFVVLGLAVGLVSLTYPLARDHALFFYGAREWLDRGQVLYRDILDHKTPGIYVIYAIAIEIFGKHEWSIRALELFVALPAVAVIGARLATPRGERIAPGVIGAAWLGACILDVGYLSYWDSAQCEIWLTIFATGALAVVWHAKHFVRACAVAGAMAAIAIVIKPPSLPFVSIVLVALWLRSRQEPSWRAYAWFAASGLAVAALVVSYFAAKHALAQMAELLIGVNGAQVRNGPGVHDFESLARESGRFFRDYEPFSGVFLVLAGLATVKGMVHRDRALARKWALFIALALASWVSVAMQRKFYIYHRACIVVLFALGFAIIHRDALAFFSSRPSWTAPLATGVFAVVLFALSVDASERWYESTRVGLQYATGRMSREDFTRRFDVPGFFPCHDAELTGLWLRTHASPSDTVIVRGFEPEIYVTSGLHYTGRFVWSSFLTESWRAYHQAEWVKEDRDALVAKPPRWAVALTHDHEGLTSAPFFEGLGYTMRVEIGDFQIMERTAQGGSGGSVHE
ncbi:MAG TPA: hypothetical protein VGH87_03535 [Polyangiaceae bacterium]